MNSLIKKIFVLIIFLAIVVVSVVLINPGEETDYLGKVKSVLSKLSFSKAGIMDFSNQSNFDLSDINFDELMSETEAEEIEEPVQVDENQGTEVVPSSQMSLEEIQEKVEEVIAIAEKVKKDIEEFSALTEIQEEINLIAEKTNKVGTDANELRTLAQVQEKVDKITETANTLNQEITELV